MPLVKPSPGIWVPSAAPAGCSAYWPFTDQSIASVRAANSPGASMTATGTPTLGRGRYGPQISGFSTSNYYETAQNPFKLYGSVYPFWMACMFSVTGVTTGQIVMACSSSANAVSALWLRANDPGAGQISAFRRNDASSQSNLVGSATGQNDGLVKVCQVNVYAANSCELFLNGISIGTDSTSIATITCTHVNIGCARRSSGTTSAATGSTVIASAVGSGVIPNAWRLYADWISGQFSAVRPNYQNFLLGAYVAGAGAGSEKYRFFSPGGDLFGLQGV